MSAFATLFVCSLVAGLINPSTAMARQEDDDDLRERQHSVTGRINQSFTHVDEISVELIRAQELVDQAEADLSSARSYLAGLHEQVAQAELFDQEMQAKLENARVRLHNARTDLKQGRVDVTATRASLASYAVSNYQAGGIELSSLGIAFDSQTAQDAVDSFQDVDTVVNKESVALQELQAQEVLFQLTRERVRETKRSVRESRLLAADNLENKRTLEAQAAAAEREVALKVETLRLEEQRVETAKRDELEKLRTLENERDRIEQMLRELAERQARQYERQLIKREARQYERQLAKREARQYERQLAKREARQQENAISPPSTAPSPPPSTAPSAPPSTPPSPPPSADPPAEANDGGILAYPGSGTYVTSPYGMRLHPILNIYKLHDGVDFSAACGSEVYAAADGRIADAYYNAGYGNRMIIDHGYVNGVSLATSYNHLTSFVAQPGDSVSRGQLIAYAGTTGYSTACHLHFMVHVNGSTVDPLTWL